MFYEKVQADGLGLTGCSRAMFSNGLSYWLGTNGKLKCGQNNLQMLRICQNLTCILPDISSFLSENVEYLTCWHKVEFGGLLY